MSLSTPEAVVTSMQASDVERWLALGNRVPEENEPADKKMRTSGSAMSDTEKMRKLRESLHPDEGSMSTMLSTHEDAQKILEDTPE